MANGTVKVSSHNEVLPIIGGKGSDELDEDSISDGARDDEKGYVDDRR